MQFWSLRGEIPYSRGWEQYDSIEEDMFIDVNFDKKVEVEKV